MATCKQDINMSIGVTQKLYYSSGVGKQTKKKKSNIPRNFNKMIEIISTC